MLSKCHMISRYSKFLEEPWFRYRTKLNLKDKEARKTIQIESSENAHAMD